MVLQPHRPRRMKARPSVLPAQRLPQQETDFSTQDPYTVKLLIPGDAKTEDCKEVSEAASKILQEKYNTTLDITRVGFGSYPDQVNLMLSSGEKLDVLYNNRDIFVSAVNNGQIVPMEEYLSEYGPDLLTEIPEERWACTSLNGKKYAVPANKEIAVSWGFACVKEMADATGVDYSNIKTEDDLLPLLEAAKEKVSRCMACGGQLRWHEHYEHCG